MKAWRAALAAAIATAAISFVAFAPAAQNGKSAGKLKITTASKSSNGGTALASCPQGYVAIGGGFASGDQTVINNQKQDENSWIVQVAPAGKRAGSLTAKVVCAKGANGLRVVDSGNEKTARR